MAKLFDTTPDADLDFLLRPDERVLWEGSPDVPPSSFAGSLVCAVLSLVPLLFGIFAGEIRERGGRIIANGFQLCVGFTALLLITSLIHHCRSLVRPVRYILTDQRAVIGTPGLLRPGRVDVFDLDSLDLGRVRIAEMNDGRGDLVLQEWPVRRGFLEIRDVRRVESLLRATRKGRASEDRCASAGIPIACDEPASGRPREGRTRTILPVSRPPNIACGKDEAERARSVKDMANRAERSQFLGRKTDVKSIIEIKLRRLGSFAGRTNEPNPGASPGRCRTEARRVGGQSFICIFSGSQPMSLLS